MRPSRPGGSLPRLVLGALGAAGLTLGATAQASAGGSDFAVAGVSVNQAIQTGSTQLVGGRSTFVRTTVRLLGDGVETEIDGLMRVFVDGIEIPESPVYSLNGPFLAKQVVDQNQLGDTLNFVFIPPVSTNVVLQVEINPAGPNFVPEANLANNVRATNALNFKALKVAEFAYAPIDYRPSGGATPNLPPENLILPGSGDNFLQGIYPLPDWYYHRTDAPNKLWTSSLASSGSPLLNSLAVDIELMSPRPDILYGWIPGGLSYNGQSVIGGPVSMGNTQSFKFQRTMAHEVGHNTGLFHNTSTTNLVGIDVEHHLNLTEALPQLKATSLKDIMYAGLNTDQAWVATSSYTNFLNHPWFAAGGDTFADAPGAPTIMVTGLWNRATNTLSLGDVLELPAAQATEAAPIDQADLIVRAFHGGELVLELPLATRNSLDVCPECRGESAAHDDHATSDEGAGDSNAPLTETGFTVKLPASVDGKALERVTIGTRTGPSASLELERSAHAPVARFTTSTGQVAQGSRLHVTWDASDADGDALKAFLTYSPDGARKVPLATGVAQTSFDVDLGQLPAFVSGRGFFELLVSDGLRTTTVRSDALVGQPTYSGAPIGNAPWIEVITPDSGKSGLYGATTILHSSGWDLEDRQISGASIVWTSDLDGVIASGRHTSTAALSVGTHVLTATATDSDGNTTSANTTYTVLARDLPASGNETCQVDLGAGTPGGATLSMCGGDLSTGTTADLLLTGAPPSTQAYLVLSFTNGSVSLLGGTLVPFPLDFVAALTTDGAGEISIPNVAGGGGPATVFAQVLLVDGGQPSGWSFSNALQIDYLP